MPVLIEISDEQINKAIMNCIDHNLRSALGYEWDAECDRLAKKLLRERLGDSVESLVSERLADSSKLISRIEQAIEQSLQSRVRKAVGLAVKAK